ncbi:MAG: AAA ATPase [Heterodermia speciosa]|uniref:Cell division control protein n=1 Tax=Heterodermia speciosa TaxID=116794 RepID=A0A8H3FK59_9LECA|nr:MAG: AAA ATPase [Heterodermia speciosa]
MASSILGKRARAADSSEDCESISSRLKRRAKAPVIHDENATQHGNDHGNNADSMDIDRLGHPSSTPSTSLRNVRLSPKSKVSHGKLESASAKPIKSTKISTLESVDKENTQLATPKTPRHRDALSKRVPVTPRHRVGLVGKPSTPHALRTPSTPNSLPTLYNDARKLFVRSADPGRLVGRDEERAELSSFIQGGIKSQKGRCLYVSGPPGTGKSALVGEVCQDVQNTVDVRMSYINCMAVKGLKDIYGKLANDLIDGIIDEETDEMTALKDLFLPKRKSSSKVYVVTLDEIDHLLTLDLEILYTLFEWSLHSSSRLVLVGIANALDLTDRFLPRLKARNLKPQLLPFLPYTAPQIASVLTSKLKSILVNDSTQPDHLPFVHPTAIQFCSKKVASQTGDLRKAFDITRRAIDLVEMEVKQKHLSDLNSQMDILSPSKSPLGENPNLSSPSRPKTLAASLASLTPITAPRVTIAHIARITSAALGNGTPQRLQTLNLQQKAALCALISLERSIRREAKPLFATPTKTPSSSQITTPTIRKLYGTYCLLCKRDNALHPLTSTEFVDVISGLETLGLVGEEGRGFGVGKVRGTPGKKIGRGKEDRSVVSWVGEKEVEGCLEGPGAGILRGLLRGDE